VEALNKGMKTIALIDTGSEVPGVSLGN
jgi:hypothetical protein